MQFKHNKCILRYISSPFPHRLFQIRIFNKCIYLALTYQIKYRYTCSILTFPLQHLAKIKIRAKIIPKTGKFFTYVQFSNILIRFGICLLVDSLDIRFNYLFFEYYNIFGIIFFHDFYKIFGAIVFLHNFFFGPKPIFK